MVCVVDTAQSGMKTLGLIEYMYLPTTSTVS